MDSSSSHQSEIPKPKPLKTLASNVKFSGGNVLLHKFVLDNSHPNDASSEIYVRAVLMSMSDAPASAVNALNDEGFTALHLAVLKQNLLLVTKLLSCLTNIDVNAKGGLGDENTALHLAVESGHLSIIQELFNRGASIGIENRAGETALMVAIKLHALDIVKMFVSADVNQHTSFGTPLHLAVRYGSLEIAEFLIDQGADIHARGLMCGVPIQFAVCEGKLDVVKLLVCKGADLNVRDERVGTLLHVAVMMGKFDCAAFLIDQGADLHAVDENGWTPLHAAALKDRVDLVRALLDRGVDVNARGILGNTPLHAAALGGHVDVLLALLDRGADVNARDVRGWTPLDMARARQNQSCIDALQNVG